jgi:hypothetical protein
MTLLEVLVADENVRDDVRRLVLDRLRSRRQPLESAHDEVHDLLVRDVADRRDDQVGRRVGVAEIVPQPRAREPLHRLLRAENRTSERVVLPEVLGEHLVNQVVGRVLDHLDLFEDDLLLALDIVLAERRTHDDVGEDVYGQRQVLVEHFDVIAGVFLGGEGIHLAADGVDGLGDVLRAAGGGALEEHVLDKMRDAALFLRLMTRPTGEPDADAHRPHVRHPLRQDAEPVGQDVANDG